MSFDFSQFFNKTTGPREQHPIKIYDNLPKGKVNDLWRGQYLALEELHHELDQGRKHVVVLLNTGGGKTVIGLLEGQSITNRSLDRVFYLCGSNQLIVQTAQAAERLGLSVATYFSRNMVNELEFNTGEIQCLTNYQTLFNGKNTRFRREIEGIIFDDAHVASHIVRENFTLQIPASEFPTTYATLVGQVRQYFESIHRGPEFDQVVTFKDDPSILFIPLFVWRQVVSRIIESLTNEGVTSKMISMFAWEHLRNNLDLCVAFLSSDGIEISPFLPPVNTLPYMSSSVTKVFLSATMQNKPEFIRTFGFLPDAYIEPKTSAGESERLIVTPYVNPSLKDGMFDYIIFLSKYFKILIIPKSEPRAKRWREHEMSFSSDDFTQKVEEFKNAQTGILVAPARFEGMDFPGDTCRFLVIDGLPSGTGNMERFLWNNLGENKFLQGTVASRLIQAMGRISRGNDDYGTVFLLGDDIGDWITRGSNRKVIPPYTRSQLELGEQLTKSISDFDNLHKLVMSVVAVPRDIGWTSVHTARIQPHSVANEKPSEDVMSEFEDLSIKVAFAERKFLEHLWDREYTQATRALEQHLDSIFNQDKALAAWHAHWLGYAHLLGGNTSAAERYFNRASKAYRVLGRINPESVTIYAPPVIFGDSQGERIASVLSARGDFNYGSFSEMQERLSPLFTEKCTTNQYEEALSWMGKYLGFASNRPDSETGGRGPDIFWTSPEVDILIESKEEKKDTSFYSKRDVGQSLNHSEWYKEEFPNSERSNKLMIVGPIIPAHPTASPGEQMHIWTPSEISAIANRIYTLLFDAYSTSDSATYTATLNKMLDEAGLTYVKLLESLPDRPIKRGH
ncbi:helicase C-terminal domain-containing protein [Paenibacillus sp. DR312]|uniref:helicase C-terminal domain-containing protein n=1 Tax=Paenibacillus sp. DR312 TaxID=2871175 RepID=UPI001C9661E8|nr:helicase C-terminal domain-containing protein [Paenibacillus sp. DR312]QZN77669.1 DEAD/DEAH box helicase family protein [Paenibacillus sp. DR312]